MNLDDQLQKTLNAVGDAYVQNNPGDFAKFRDAVSARRRRRRVFLSSSVVVAGTALAAIVFAFSGDRVVDQSVPVAGRDEVLQQAVQIPVGENPSAVVSGAGFLWVTNPLDQTLTKVDIRSRTVVDTIDIGVRGEDVSVGTESVWVGDEIGGTIVRVDPRTGELGESVDVGPGLSDLDTGLGYVWAVRGNEVLRIDQSTGAIDETVELGSEIVDIEVSQGNVWALETQKVTQIENDDELRTTPVNVALESPQDISISRDAVWVADPGANRMVRIDTTSQSEAGEYTLDGEYLQTAASAAGVFVIEEVDGVAQLVRLNPNTGEVVGSKAEIGGDPTEMIAWGTFVWITDASTGSLMGFDIASLD